MSNSGRLLDYLGSGTHASRPSSLSIAADACGIYYETDTTNTFIWTGSAWSQVNGGGGGGSSTPGFPFPIRQGPTWGQSFTATTIAATFGVTPTSGDFLLAITLSNPAYSVGTPSGWTLWFSASGTSGQWNVYYKSSNGTESGFSAAMSGGSGNTNWVIQLVNFLGARTPDKHASASGGSALSMQAPALTSPTSGAGVVAVAFPTWNNGNLYPSKLIPLSPDANWVETTYDIPGGYGTFIAGYWMGKVGSQALGYPTFTVYLGTTSPTGICSISFSLT